MTLVKHSLPRFLVASTFLTTLTLSLAGNQGAGPVSAMSSAARLDSTATLTATTATATQATSVSATPALTVPGTSTAMAARPSATGIPSSTPTAPKIKVRSTVHRTNGYQIGSYYFSGWSHAPNNNMTDLLVKGAYKKYEPTIGWYDDSQQQVDKNITLASQAGINFFAFDWYDTALSPYITDKTLNEGLGYFLTSKIRNRMNFAITFIDQAPFLPRASDWPKLVDYWVKNYFTQPDYVRVNGKPLFIVFSPEHFRDIFKSSDAVRKALDYLRARAIAAHLPGVTIATGATFTANYNPNHIGQFKTEGWDLTTGYNYHATGNEQYNKPVPYATLIKENEQMWNRVSTLLPIPYMPVVTSGWDQRFSEREQKTKIIYANRTPAQFKCYVGAARHWIDTNAKRTTKEKLVMIFAWNEIGEGGSIIPNLADGSAYTNALYQAFTTKNQPIC